jgi:predicted  nucleic acid-binding Zn-ribbon protein
MSDEVAALKGEVAEHKRRAGELSAGAMRDSKTIGALQDELKKLAALQAEFDQLDAECTDLKSQLKAANTANEAAAKQAVANASKVKAAEQIKKGLAAL